MIRIRIFDGAPKAGEHCHQAIAASLDACWLAIIGQLAIEEQMADAAEREDDPSYEGAPSQADKLNPANAAEFFIGADFVILIDQI